MCVETVKRRSDYWLMIGAKIGLFYKNEKYSGKIIPGNVQNIIIE